MSKLKPGTDRIIGPLYSSGFFLRSLDEANEAWVCTPALEHMFVLPSWKFLYRKYWIEFRERQWPDKSGFAVRMRFGGCDEYTEEGDYRWFVHLREELLNPSLPTNYPLLHTISRHVSDLVQDGVKEFNLYVRLLYSSPFPYVLSLAAKKG